MPQAAASFLAFLLPAPTEQSSPHNSSAGVFQVDCSSDPAALGTHKQGYTTPCYRCRSTTARNPRPPLAFMPVFIFLKPIHTRPRRLLGAQRLHSLQSSQYELWPLSLTCQTCSTLLPETWLSAATPPAWALDANCCPTSSTLPFRPAHLLIL